MRYALFYFLSTMTIKKKKRSTALEKEILRDAKLIEDAIEKSIFLFTAKWAPHGAGFGGLEYQLKRKNLLKVKYKLVIALKDWDPKKFPNLW